MEEDQKKKLKLVVHQLLREGVTYVKLQGIDRIVAIKVVVTKAGLWCNLDGTPEIDSVTKKQKINIGVQTVIFELSQDEYNSLALSKD